MRRNPRRAEVDPQHPAGWATSDRNGHIGNLHNMKWQMEWRGSSVVNTRVLVHEDELDIPQRQLGTLVIPPDPPPLFNARPENYDIDEQPVSTRYTIGPDGRASLIRVIINNEPWYSNRILLGQGANIPVGPTGTPGVPGLYSGVVSTTSSSTVAVHAVMPAGSGAFALTGNAATLSKVASAFATLDPATVSGATLSNGNLTVTNTGTSSTNQGAMALASSAKSTGKYYFEINIDTITSQVAQNQGYGIGTPTSTYTGLGSLAAGGVVGVYVNNGFGAVIINGVGQGITIVGLAQGAAFACAVDLTNRLIWVKAAGLGTNWNSTVGADPATGVGGLAVPAGPMLPFVTFGGVNGAAGNVLTANFGLSTFAITTGLFTPPAVPTGFTAGWPV